MYLVYYIFVDIFFRIITFILLRIFKNLYDLDRENSMKNRPFYDRKN